MQLELRDYQVATKERVVSLYEQNAKGKAKFVWATGCHRAGQGILMHDGAIKPVEEIKIGDLLMGSDSTARQVLFLHQGQDQMIEICPVTGNSWVVNKGHILILVQTNKRTIRPSTKDGTVQDVQITDWFNWSATQKHLHKLFRVSVDFPQHTIPLPVHPYLIGALLGDGGLTDRSGIHFTNIDEPVVREIERIVQTYNLRLHPMKCGNRTQTYAISGKTGRSAHFVKDGLRALKLFPIRCEGRFIPHEYKTASRKDRLELLAGLIDTDGHYNHGRFEFCSKSQQLANDVMFVVRSLGLAAYKSPKEINGTTYYCVSISGDCSIVPTRIPRKQSSVRLQKKDVLRTGFTCKPTGTIENYYGFTVDGDNRYLLDDFTVTHNCGKTVGFSAIAHEIQQKTGINVLIIAHRDELLTQAAQKYRYIDPDAHIGKVGGGSQEWGHPVTVASIQTIARPQHLRNLKHFGFGLVIIDECHHAHAGNEYGKVLNELPDAFRIGCTATDDRLDRLRNDDLFGESVLTVSILDAIEQGFLTNVRAIAIKTGTSLDGLHSREGDYQVKELAEKINTPSRNKKIVDAYLQHASDRQAMAFAVDIAHATDLAQAFTEQGVAAVAVSGKTHNRGQILKDFEQGKYRVLCNCQVFTEGYDAETTYVEDEDRYIFLSCAIMARPTKSRGLFVQCIGRILRLAPTKKDALILDATDNILNHRLEPQSLAKVIGVQLEDDESVTEAKERKENAEREKRERKTKVSRTQDVVINVLARLDWKQRDDGMYTLEVGKEKHKIAIVADTDNDDQPTGYYTVWARLAPFFDAQMWAEDVPLDMAQQIAEKKARLLISDVNNIKLIDRNAPWRRYPASERQIEMLKRFGIPVQLDEFNEPIITKGEAADILDPIFEKLKNKKGQGRLAV